jgi:steroid delta-isomerase-like uncharacterized protein
MMSTERTRETMQAYAEALLSSGDFGRYLADDVTLVFMGANRRVQGRDAVRQLITFIHEIAFRTAIEVKTVLCDGARAAIEAEFVGTHIGEFEGVPASHRDVRLPYAVSYDVENGRISSLRLYFALDELLRQIGAAETREVAQAV